MTYMTLVDLAEGIFTGKYAEGDIFETGNGERASISQGALRWVTSGDYLASPVGITEETLTSGWRKARKLVEKRITFVEALESLANGQSVTLTPDGYTSKYEVSSFMDVERLLEDDAYLEHLYRGHAVVMVEPEDENKQTETTAESVSRVADEGLVGFVSLLAEIGSGDKPAEDTKETEISSTGHKLDSLDALDILMQRHFAKDSVSVIAERYGITDRMVYYIIDGTYWTDVHATFHKDFPHVSAGLTF